MVRIHTITSALSLLALAACSTPMNAPIDGSATDAAIDDDASSGPDNWGFRPETHAFSFENYGNEGSPTNLGPDEMRRLFGAAACLGTNPSSACDLAPQLGLWMNHRNAAMAGGHCEGMAVAAAMLFTRALDASAFGAASAVQIRRESSITREIAVRHATQFLLPSAERRTLTPTQIVDELSRSFVAGRAYAGTVLGIYRRDGGGGHSLLPYALRRPSAERVEVLVYDSNLPSGERVLTVDRAANTWRYEAASPASAGSTYEGDASSFNLSMNDVAPRTSTVSCALCGDSPMDGGAMQPVQISLLGAANVSVTDAMGRVTGRDAMGAEVNAIPGASATRARSAALFNDDPEPEYVVPRAGALTIALDNARGATAAPTGLLVTAQGFAVALNGITLGAMQRDVLTLQPGAPDVLYRPSSSGAPELAVGFQRGGNGVLVSVRPTMLAADTTVRTTINYEAHTVRVALEGGASAPVFSLTLTRNGAGGNRMFNGGNISRVRVLQFDYDAWTIDRSALMAQVDRDGDGTFDESIAIPDES